MKTILTSLKSNRFSAVLILLTIVFCLIGFRPASAATVGIDNVHFAWRSGTCGTLVDLTLYEAADPLTCGSYYDKFREVIEDLGHTVVPLNSFEADDLSTIDVAILMPPKDNSDELAYSDSQIAAIRSLANRAVFLSDQLMMVNTILWNSTLYDNDILAENIINFLSDSGGVLFISMNAWGGTNLPDYDNWNKLVEPYGVWYDPEKTEPYYHYITDFVGHPITAGLANIAVGPGQTRITARYPSLNLTINCDGIDNSLAVYDPFSSPASLTVFVNDDSTQTEGVAGFDFAPGSDVTLEIDYGNGGCAGYRATKTADSNGGVRFSEQEVLALNTNDVVRLYDNHSPPNITQHVVDYLTLRDVDLLLDTLGGNSNPNEEIYVRVFDPDQPSGGFDFTDTANIYGSWQVSSEVDIGLGSSGWVQTNDPHGNHTQINWEVPVRNLQVIWNSDSTQIRGLVGYGWEPGSEVTFEIYYGDFRDGNPQGGAPVCLTSVIVESDGVVRFLPYDQAGSAGSATPYNWSCPDSPNYFYMEDIGAWNGIVASDYDNDPGPQYSKFHMVEFLRIDQVDWENDTISGQADPGKEVEVRVIDPSLPFPQGHDLTTVADSGGNWSVSYAGTFDIKVGDEGWAQISDHDGDSTRVNWHIISLPPDLEVDGTLEFEPGGSYEYVNDDQYVEAAGVRVSGEWLTEPIDVKIHVFEEKPFGLPVITSDMTHYMSIELDPSSYPLPPMGLDVRLPLDKYTHPEFAGEMFTLYRVDSETGDLVPAPSWHWEGSSPVLRPWTDCHLERQSANPDPTGTDPCQTQACTGEPHFVECYNVAQFSTLVGVFQEEVQVMIDIKPGSDSNCTKVSKKGTLPVAILSTSNVDLSSISVNTIVIDDDHDPATEGISYLKSSFKKDVNGDGDLDCVLHFSTPDLNDAGLLVDGKTLYITGTLDDGTPILGSDIINLAGGPNCFD